MQKGNPSPTAAGIRDQRQLKRSTVTFVNSFVRAKRPDGSECVIDLMELESALDFGSDARNFFNPESGEIVSYGGGEEEDEDDEEFDIAGLLPIDSISSRERFGWMEDFIDAVYSITAQSSLRKTLREKKPFRQFKDALMEYPAVRQQWFAFEAQKVRKTAVSFIQELDWEVLEIVDTTPRSKPAVEEVELAARLAPTEEERDWILRGASEIAAKGGRTQLALLLKGSRDKKLLKHNLDQSPAYGKLSFLTIEEIENRIDHSIRNNDLSVEFFGDLPLIVLTNSAWEHVRAWSYEQDWRRAAAADARTLNQILLQWRNRPRSEQVLLLDTVTRLDPEAGKRVLQAWFNLAGKEMRARIEERLAKQGG